MNVFKKIQAFFISKATAASDDPFDNVRVVVLLNFSLFLFFTNLPYTFISLSHHWVHFTSAIVQNIVMMVVIYFIIQGQRIQLAIKIFMINFALQNSLHFFINNGVLMDQGVLFYVLIILMSFVLLGRRWGVLFTLIMCVMICTGIYNVESGYKLFKFAPELGDPTIEGNMKYLVVLPLLLNVYLISEFVRAQDKARQQLNHQKKAVVEKNREITDSLHYTKRIQTSLLTNEKYISKVLNILKGEKP